MRTQRHGWSRPVAVPDDLDNVNRVVERGIICLPLHIFWSGPDRTWDLSDVRQRVQVYELVLTEGTEDDILHFIDLDELIRLWSALWLPIHVRTVWAAHLKHLRGVDLAC